MPFLSEAHTDAERELGRIEVGAVVAEKVTADAHGQEVLRDAKIRVQPGRGVTEEHRADLRIRREVRERAALESGHESHADVRRDVVVREVEITADVGPD